jgi:phosphoglycerate dehydrogenase-like enzyme
MSSKQHTVTFIDPIDIEQLAFLQNLANDYDLNLTAPSSDDPKELLKVLKTCEGAIVQRRPLTRELIDAAPNLKVIQKMGGRRDRIDVKAAKAKGIKVALMSLPGAMAVSEHVMALILACAKKIVEAHSLTVNGAYRQLGVEPKVTTERSHGFQWMKIQGLEELNGMTLGIIGFGDIGNEIAKRANAFDMNVIYYDGNRLDEDLETELNVKYAPKTELLKTADFITLNAPLTPHTEKSIGESELALMKPTAYLINASRGGVVDEPALAKAIAEGRIAGAGLDVFLEEPVPFDHPYLSLKNVTFTPHIAGGKGGAKERQPRAIFANLQRFFNGKAMEKEIV